MLLEQMAKTIELVFRKSLPEEELTPEIQQFREGIVSRYEKLKLEFNLETPGFKHSFTSAEAQARREFLLDFLRPYLKDPT